MSGWSAGIISFLIILIITPALLLSNVSANEKTSNGEKESQKGVFAPGSGVTARILPIKSEYSTAPSNTPGRTQKPVVLSQQAAWDENDEYHHRSHAQSVIEANKNLLGIGEENIRLVSGNYDGPSYANHNSGTSYVFYEQMHNGIPIYGSYIGLISVNGEDVLIKSNVYPGISVGTEPSINADDAVKLAQTNLGTDSDPLNYSLMIFPVNYEKNDYVLAWKIQFSTLHPPAAWEIFVDAQKRKVIFKQNRILDLSVSGNVIGFVYPENPSRPKAVVNFSGLNVSAFQNGKIVGSSITNANGSYNITGVSGDVYVISELNGPFVNVINEDQSKANHSLLVSTPSVHNWNWSANDTSYKQEESNVFYHVNRIHDFITKGSPFDISQMNYQVPANVEYGSSSCNAFADPNAGSINFFGPDGGCEATSLGSDVIYHEYTHLVIDKVMNILDPSPDENGGSIHEGVADYFSATLRNDSVIGNEILPESSIRYLNNSLKMPEDFSEEVHDDGRIIAGALWDLRGLLGNSTADNLTIRTMKLRGQTFTQFLADMFIADDNNGNLADGTPHTSEICRAFYVNHGIFNSYCPVTPIYGKPGDKIYLLENNTPTIINDYPLPGNSSSITVPNQLSGNVSNISVFVGINHTYIGDLKIQLQSPSGKSIFLHYLTGGPTNNLFTWYGNETVPKTPEGLHQFLNEPANGTWLLKVADHAEVDTGTITKWKLLITVNMLTPRWSLNNSYLHETYEAKQNYSFKIAWNDTEGDGPSAISQAVFELNSMNYTKYTSPAVANDSQGIFWINLTDLSAGLYSYKWYANNTLGMWNSTASLQFSVHKQPTNTTLLLNSTPGDFAYNISTFANFTAFVNVTGKNVTLTSDIPGWLDQNATDKLYNTTLLVKKGAYNITAYFAGDQNYSESLQTHFAIIKNTQAPLILGNFSLPESGADYNPTRNYTFNVTAEDDIGIENVIFQFDLLNYTASVYSTGSAPPLKSGNWSVTLHGLGANESGHKLIWYVNDSYDNWNRTGEINYAIKKNTSAYTIIRLNKTPSDDSETFDFEVGEPFYIYVSASDPAITFNIYENLSTPDTPELAISQNGILEADTYISSAGGYHVWINSSENENYTANNTLSHIFIRSKDTITPRLTESIIAPRSIKRNSNVTFMTISEDYSDTNASVNIYNKTNPSSMRVYMGQITWKGNTLTNLITFNSSILETGTFYVNVSLTDASGNSANYSIGNITVSDSVGSNYYSNTYLPIEEKIELNLSSELNISLNISSSSSGSTDSLVVSSYNTNPSNDNTNGVAINKFSEISAGGFLSDVLNWVEMRIFYSSSDIPAGYDENNLRIYYNHPNGTWLPYEGSGSGGVNTTEKYVWANSTHFSIYGVFVMPTCSDGIQNQDESGADCGGTCSACASSAPHISGGGGGGGGSSITTTTTTTTSTTTTAATVSVKKNNETAIPNITQPDSKATNSTKNQANLNNSITGAVTSRTNSYLAPIAVIGLALIAIIAFKKLIGHKKPKSAGKKLKFK
ncbi:MAG: proprotein convertase P-domain-containing protein [Candidatus Aenigmarchaeota archaeon]|nr:proprotein convertase P-domain-containing protein [Candidatus Aenigmarchaeota archaeon]